MALIKRSTFEPHPEGLTVGTLADVKFDEEGKFGPQIRWDFDTEEEMSDGRPFRIAYWTTPTLNEKSNLYRLLKGFGEDPEEERWEEIEDAEELFDAFRGRKVQLNIIHKKGENGLNARIDTVLPVKRLKPRTTGEGNGGGGEERAKPPRVRMGETHAARGEERETVSVGTEAGSKAMWKDED